MSTQSSFTIGNVNLHYLIIMYLQKSYAIHMVLNLFFLAFQAQSELQSPILLELAKVVDGKQCIICETVNSEFREIVSMCGGPQEKTRAKLLLKQLM